jgi:hypothetical protein
MASPIISTLVQRFDQKRDALQPALTKTRLSFPEQIDDTDSQIDKLVYELYGLTAKEINL